MTKTVCVKNAEWAHISDTFGLPINQTTIADKLKEVGYSTHQHCVDK